MYSLVHRVLGRERLRRLYVINKDGLIYRWGTSLSEQYMGSNSSHTFFSDILRLEVKSKTALGLELNDYMTKGLLVPDDVANKVMLQHINKVTESGFILDGFPRTINQAEFLTNNLANGNQNNIEAINITLAKWVAIEKLLARSACSTCGAGFNTADIMRDGYDMPAILPNKHTCRLGPEQCNPVLVSRNDDSVDVIERRFEEYAAKTKPLLEYYNSKGALKNFEVRKGVKDTDALFALMVSKNDF